MYINILHRFQHEVTLLFIRHTSDFQLFKWGWRELHLWNFLFWGLPMHLWGAILLTNCIHLQKWIGTTKGYLCCERKPMCICWEHTYYNKTKLVRVHQKNSRWMFWYGLVAIKLTHKPLQHQHSQPFILPYTPYQTKLARISLMIVENPLG